MSEYRGILLREDTLEAMQALSDEQRGRLVLALFSLSGLCEAPELDTTTRVAFICLSPSVIRAQDAAKRRNRASIENGKKGGRPRSRTLEKSGENPALFLEKRGVSENASQANPKPSQTKRSGEERRGGFRPPTLSEAKEYCAEEGFSADAGRFVDYYAAQGWRLGSGQPMRDWKAALRNWERRDAQKLPAFQLKDEVRQMHNNEVCRQIIAEFFPEDNNGERES